MSLTTEPSNSQQSSTDQLMVVEQGGTAIIAEEGAFKRRLPARWLRLMGSDPRSMVGQTGQRAFDSTSIPAEVRVRSASFNSDEGVWEIRFEGETEVVEIDFERLRSSANVEQIDGPTAFALQFRRPTRPSAGL